MADKKIRCVSCGKPIAEEISIQAGYVKITCRCGTVNEIKAEQKEQVPYGERMANVITLKSDGVIGNKLLPKHLR